MTPSLPSRLVPNHPSPARRSLAGLALLGSLASSALTPSLAEANSTNNDGCKGAFLTGSSQIDVTGAYQGDGTLELEGKEQAVKWVSVILTAVAAPDGTLTLTGTHHIVSQNGGIDFTTSDAVTATPTSAAGQYEFASDLTVVSGQGRVHSGFLRVHGRFDAARGSVVIDSSEGGLCSKP